MIYEFRTYRLKTGATTAYLAIVSEEGIEVQKSHLGQLVGYFSSEIGPLNEVVHIWAYEDLADRSRRRAALAADPRWLAVVSKIVPLIETMENKIMLPAQCSPLQ